MGRSKLSIVFYIIIGLAVVGLATQLITSPGSFFKGIFITLGIGVAIFALIYFVLLRKRAPSNDMKQYKKAVRQSKAKYKPEKENISKSLTKKQPNLLKKKRNKRSTNHLRVIEGNKTKGKDRATF